MGGIEFTFAELRPKRLVFGALPVSRLNKHAVVLAFDFVERIADSLEEIGIGMNDRAIDRKFDHGLRAPDRGNLRCHFAAA